MTATLRRALTLGLALMLTLGVTLTASAANGFAYRHDPRLNPTAMADVIADESAVYGFRPSESGSLSQYAAFDWSDPAVVAQARQVRIEYHQSVESMYDMLNEMKAKGDDIETIARAVSNKRNELRMAANADDPVELAATKARNLQKYGHEEGPLPEEQFAKYGSWEIVLAKAFTTNSGMDACVGLYDDYYDLYATVGQVPADNSLSPKTGDARKNAAGMACVLLLCATLAGSLLVRRHAAC